MQVKSKITVSVKMKFHHPVLFASNIVQLYVDCFTTQIEA